MQMVKKQKLLEECIFKNKIMNWLKRIFNQKKTPRAINEIKPVDMNKYIHPELRMFIFIKYWRVKKSWKRSPKNYYVWIADDGNIELRKFDKPNGIEKLVGNLYTLYHQYYGKENKS